MWRKKTLKIPENRRLTSKLFLTFLV
jgi:hypothetical protein